MRTSRSFQITSPLQFKNALLEWSRTFDEVVWLDSNDHKDHYSTFDAALAIGKGDVSLTALSELNGLSDFIAKNPDWLFGYFGYDLKNELEDLKSENYDGLGFPEVYFFQPSKVIVIKGNEAEFQYIEAFGNAIDEDYEQINALLNFTSSKAPKHQSVHIKLRIHKDAYFEKVNALLARINRGDVYEANFCQEFYAENISINPLDVFKNLNEISQPPFASFLRLDDKYLMCGSPERYLRKMGQQVISQPIKGTAGRGKNAAEDRALAVQLANDPKERAENIMIADLVRNDLSKSALKGSVKTNELCEVHTFSQVHQMISTITSRVKKDKNPVGLIQETFPMGSMTGAPKISAMKIIEELEETKRGLYSGAVGYFDPQGNFDFNVVIRSILYNASRKYASFSVGSAITANSNPEKEYQECLIKAKAMRSVLEGS